MFATLFCPPRDGAGVQGHPHLQIFVLITAARMIRFMARR